MEDSCIEYAVNTRDLQGRGKKDLIDIAEPRKAPDKVL